jgi:putative thioredoxin
MTSSADSTQTTTTRIATTEKALAQDISAQDFPRAVVERSRTVPVVVDFWAPWCAPCRALGPILEREVAATGGKVALVKVNTDENPELAATYRIQGIPAVKAFVGGEVVDEFVGAQSAEAIVAFLGRLVPSEASVNLGRARTALAEHRPAEAAPLLRDLLDDPQHGDEAAWDLARLHVAAGDLAAAAPLWERLEAGPFADQVASARRLADLVTAGMEFGGAEKARAAVAADSKDWEARYALAGALAVAGDYGAALAELLPIVSRQRRFRDDGARLAMLAIFAQLGADDDLVQHYRRQLQIVT